MFLVLIFLTLYGKWVFPPDLAFGFDLFFLLLFSAQLSTAENMHLQYIWVVEFPELKGLFYFTSRYVLIE